MIEHSQEIEEEDVKETQLELHAWSIVPMEVTHQLVIDVFDLLVCKVSALKIVFHAYRELKLIMINIFVCSSEVDVNFVFGSLYDCGPLSIL